MNRTLKTVIIAGLLLAVLALIGGCELAPAAEGEEQGSTSIWPMLIFLVVIFGLFYFVMIRPQRKRQKEHEQLTQDLQKGDSVMTAGGIYGRIESISEDSVVIKVESGASLRVAKTSVVVRQEK
jgi:preprotein translocase subunit YajC